MPGTITTVDQVENVQLVDNTSGLVAPVNTRNAVETTAAMPQSAQTANYTPVLADRYTTVKMNSASNLIGTLPPNVFSGGMWVAFRRVGTGALTIQGGTGVTLLGATTSGSFTARAQNSLVTCTLDATVANQWWIDGDLT